MALSALGVVALVGATGVMANQWAYETQRTKQLEKSTIAISERPWRPYNLSERFNCPEFTRGGLIPLSTFSYYQGDTRTEYWDPVSGQYLHQTTTNIFPGFGHGEAIQ